MASGRALQSLTTLSGFARAREAEPLAPRLGALSTQIPTFGALGDAALDRSGRMALGEATRELSPGDRRQLMSISGTAPRREAGLFGGEQGGERGMEEERASALASLSHARAYVDALSLGTGVPPSQETAPP